MCSHPSAGLILAYLNDIVDPVYVHYSAALEQYSPSVLLYMVHLKY